MEYETEFKPVMEGLAVNYKEPLTDPLLDLFWRAFGWLDGDVFARAAVQHMVAGDFFPRVSELRAALEATLTEEERRHDFARRNLRFAFARGLVPGNFAPEHVAAWCRELRLPPARAAELVAIAERRLQERLPAPPPARGPVRGGGGKER